MYFCNCTVSVFAVHNFRCGLSMSLLKYFPPRDGMDGGRTVGIWGRNHVEENNTSALSAGFLEFNVQLQDRSATCAQETTLDTVVLMLYEL